MAHADVVIRQEWDKGRALYAVLQPVVVLEDVNSSQGCAWYTTMDSLWRAQVSWSTYCTVTAMDVWHEMGHHFDDVVRRQGWPEVTAEFWVARGFAAVKTLEQQYADWEACGHCWYERPEEMFGEAFHASHLGTTERTNKLGVPLDAERMRRFFTERGGQDFVPRYISVDIAIVTDTNGNWAGWLPLLGLKANVPTVVTVQRVGLAGTEQTLPDLAAAAKSDATEVYVMVKRDPVRGGTAYIKLLAVQ